MNKGCDIVSQIISKAMEPKKVSRFKEAFMIKTKYIFILLLVCMSFIFLIACDINTDLKKEKTTELESSNSEVTTIQDDMNKEISIIESLLKVIKDKDKNSFIKLLSKDENIVVRSFSSGNGTRGKNIIMNIKSNDVTSDLSFSVKDETPIEMSFLFKEAIQNGIKDSNIENIPDTSIDISGIGSTQEIWDKCSRILQDMKDKDWKPHLINLRKNQFALYEGGAVDGFPIGGWIIFEKKDGSYMIKGIFDLR